MTRDEGWEQFDRFAKAGYPPPADDIIAGAFEEWFTALERYETATVADAVTRMIRTRASRFWPTVAETRDAVLALTAGARRDRPVMSVTAPAGSRRRRIGRMAGMSMRAWCGARRAVSRRRRWII